MEPRHPATAVEVLQSFMEVVAAVSKEILAEVTIVADASTGVLVRLNNNHS
jgi:hypothetical protein